MTSDTAGAAWTAPFFSARLTPHRSLGPRGFRILMCAVAALCLGVGGLFLTIGAWPVFGFFGLDILIIYVAFRLNYAAARAFEEVHVGAEDLLVRKVGARGETEEIRLHPYWVRLEVKREEDEGVTGLALLSHGRRLEIGAFLNPGDRETFAVALGRALARARSGGALPAGA
ncbi:DUF2244 domain-containing protein [Methylobrevis albus]|uniref:DUF2244 domain-containing protein n=1 Tax=Methylobrevis albus TaxID=2793297 RepID=A0A931MXR1_9HYPH|nr:DUF2244 domain-containing protein [Methylobrevis albus]MBH0236244.1 DUF2244 domain-containing protein [Methylobrevis albus]